MGIDRMEDLMEVGRRITVGGTECRGGGGGAKREDSEGTGRYERRIWEACRTR